MEEDKDRLCGDAAAHPIHSLSLRDFLQPYFSAARGLFLNKTKKKKKEKEISPRTCQEGGLLSGPLRSQFSLWRESESMLPGQKEPERGWLRDSSPAIVQFTPSSTWSDC